MRVIAPPRTTRHRNRPSLPQRLELMFTLNHTTEAEGAEKAVSDHLPILAAYDHLERHGLSAIHPTAQQIVHES